MVASRTVSIVASTTSPVPSMAATRAVFTRWPMFWRGVRLLRSCGSDCRFPVLLSARCHKEPSAPHTSPARPRTCRKGEPAKPELLRPRGEAPRLPSRRANSTRLVGRKARRCFSAWKWILLGKLRLDATGVQPSFEPGLRRAVPPVDAGHLYGRERIPSSCPRQGLSKYRPAMKTSSWPRISRWGSSSANSPGSQDASPFSDTLWQSWRLSSSAPTPRATLPRRFT